MSATLKILGQAAPNAATETLLYTVTATSVVISTIVVCNFSATTDTFRITTTKGGGATSNKDYLYYNLFLDGYDTFAATFGVTLATNDVMRCYSSSGTSSFQIYGQENN